MKGLFFRFGKLIGLSLAALLALILLMVPLSPTISAEAPDSETQIAPLNPAFIEYLQNQQTQLQTFGVAQGSSFGYIPPTFDLSHLNNSPFVQNSTELTSDTLPDSLDWRDQNKVTPVKDQGQAGTCWVFGTLASLESRIGIVEEQLYTDLYDFSEQNLVLAVDPSHVYQTANRANSGGDSFISTDALTKWGTVLESTQPYDITTLNTNPCNKNLPPLQRIVDFRIVASLGISGTDIANIKTAIQTYGPVIAAFWVDVGSVQPGYGNMYDGFVYDYPSFSDQNNYYDANHMVSIVGWDDTVHSPRTGNDGAWIVKNSWGTDWGNDGYFFLCYGAGNLQQVGSYHGSAGYEVYNASEHLYYWDEAGLVTSFGYGTTSGWMRSIFTAEKAGVLTSVNFYATDDDVQYEIYVRNSADKILSTQSGICAEMGYYTIPLTSRVPISSGQEFKIDVKITTTTGYIYPIPIEKYTSIKIGGQELPYTDPPVQTGACFFKASDQDAWEDASQYSEGSTQIPVNICLRATVDESALTPVPASSSLSVGLMMAGLATLIVFFTVRRVRRSQG
jgi:C1A family cysteine protease